MTYLSDKILTRDDFWALAEQRGVSPRRARKITKVAARRAAREERVTTLWNGEETRNTANPGDYIVTALDRAGRPLRDGSGAFHRYVIDAATFAETYAPVQIDGIDETKDGAIHLKTEVVLTLPLPEGFDIMAPWGERQRGSAGYLLLNGDDVYGNQTETFAETYEFVDAP